MKKILIISALLCACGPVGADRYQDAVDSQRLAHDNARDQLREPARVLRQIGIEPGITVLDMGAGDGYYTEILARLVGSSGRVYLQNPSFIYQRFGDDIVVQRLADGRLSNVVRWDHEPTDLQLPPGSIDLAFAHLTYHDMFWMSKDMDAIHQQIWKSLKPGGRLVIIDHAAPLGTGSRHALDGKGIHRIDETYVRKEFENVGFELSDAVDILRNSEDDRTQAFFAEALRGKKTDRFFLIFRKPAK